SLRRWRRFSRRARLAHRQLGRKKHPRRTYQTGSRLFSGHRGGHLEVSCPFHPRRRRSQRLFHADRGPHRAPSRKGRRNRTAHLPRRDSRFPSAPRLAGGLSCRERLLRPPPEVAGKVESVSAKASSEGFFALSSL